MSSGTGRALQLRVLHHGRFFGPASTCKIMEFSFYSRLRKGAKSLANSATNPTSQKEVAEKFSLHQTRCRVGEQPSYDLHSGVKRPPHRQWVPSSRNPGDFLATINKQVLMSPA
jgi:hypothetical protein